MEDSISIPPRNMKKAKEILLFLMEMLLFASGDINNKSKKLKRRVNFTMRMM